MSHSEKRPISTPSQSGTRRRTFLTRAGGAVAATLASQALSLPGLSAAESSGDPGDSETLGRRIQECFQIRVNAAKAERHAQITPQLTNGDEARYPNRIGNFSKGLPHNSLGEVDRDAYNSLLNAVSSGDPEDFERIILGGNTRLVDPQAGLAFDMEGADSHALTMDTPPALASAERAGEAVECYWMALLRDVSFSDYDTDPTALEACAELSRLTDFRGPKDGGRVTPKTLFRGFTAGDTLGPYASQFILHPIEYGAIHIEQKFNSYPALSQGGRDYMTDQASWLTVQNGAGPFGPNLIDPSPRHVRNGGSDLDAAIVSNARLGSSKETSPAARC